MATPTDDDNADDCISGNYYGYERGGTLDHKGESDEEEAEAKFFAKYAAAPPPLVHHLQSPNPDNVAEIFSITYTAAVYACNYYRKWLAYGETFYKDYEIRLLALFFDAEAGSEPRYDVGVNCFSLNFQLYIQCFSVEKNTICSTSSSPFQTF